MEYVVLCLLRNYIVPTFCTNCICVPGKISKQPFPAPPHCEGRLLRAVQAHGEKEVAGKKTNLVNYIPEPSCNFFATVFMK